MRNFGYKIIYLVQLARYFGFVDAIKIFFGLIMGRRKHHVLISPKKFNNPVSIRKAASDLPIFYQVFCDLQYDISFFLDFTPMSIIDAGANVGYASLYFSNQYPQAKIISIEPESRNFEQLKMNAVAYPNIKPIQGGVWNQSGWAHIKNIQEADASFEIEVDDKEGTNTFKTFSILDIMEIGGFNSIDILKMDIEGAEYFVFSENPESWLQHTKCIVIELHDHLQQGTSKLFFEAMSKFDWKTFVKGENLVCIKA